VIEKKQPFDVPIGLMTFLRTEGALKILSVIKRVQPKKLYILSDGPRNEKERKIIIELREKLLRSVTWDCEVFPIFRESNVGVYQNIARGAKEIFSREKWAIFLEDDNLPDETFFYFCREMLYRYENDGRIFWICGTNYLAQTTPSDNADYYFTQALLPCGWASWSVKFLKYYDDDFVLALNKNIRKKAKKTYVLKSLYYQQMRSINAEIYRHKHGMKYISWDFQLILTLRANDLFWICPRNNLITNF
jgi:hypothetical protein